MSEQDSNNKMENADNKEASNKKTFVERIFHDDIEGEYDDQGFFNTPNGSFWDPDGVYFNREGFDKHGGYYDDNNEYIPGKGWDEENNCYKDELEDEFASDHDPNEEEDDGFGEVDMEKIQDEEKLIKVEGDIEKITEDPNKIIHNIEDNENEEDKKEENKKEEKKE